MSKGTLQIDLLGSSFSIQAEENSEYLDSLYLHFKKTSSQVEQNSGLEDPIKIAIISGILIADELYKEKMKRVEQSSTVKIDLAEAEKLALRMISSIDQVLPH